MNSEVLNCYTYLHADQPKKPSPSASDWTKACLRKVGWDDNMLLPSGLDDYIVAVLDVLKLKHGRHEVEDIFELEEVQTTLRSAIIKCNAAAAPDDEIESAVKESMGLSEQDTPALQELYRVAVQAERAKREAEAKHILSEDTATTATETIQDVHLTNSDEEPTPTEEEGTTDESRLDKIHYCPRCGLDLEVAYFQEEISDDDRRLFLISILGGNPFTKEMSLFGGLLSAIFTTLTTQQEVLLRNQIGWESIHKQDTAALITSLRNDDFRLALQVKKITTSAKNLDYTIKTIPDYEDDEFAPDDSMTRLEKYSNAWYNTVVVSQALKNELRSAAARFNKLVAALSAEALSPDFWQRATMD